MKRLSVMLALLLAFALPAFAQIQGGSISGTIKDEQGGVLPGVTVSVQGVDATQTFVTEASGEFRFLNLAPGPYTVTAVLPGFTTIVREGVVVAVGASVELPVALKIAQVAETITVSGESPVDRHQGHRHATNFTADELTKIPTSRDPFALMRSGARRARRSRQHRRQRDRPAVQLRLEGHAPAGCELDDGRHRHHRHGGDRRVADAISTTTTSRKSRSRPPARTSSQPHRRHGPQPRRQARHQPVPRRRPRLLRQRRDGVDQRAGRARAPPASRTRRRITTSRSPTTASTSAARSCATRRGSTARTRSRTCGWCAAPARWSIARS